MPDRFTISLACVVRSLPQTSDIVDGRRQPPTLKRFLAHDLKVAEHLGELFDAMLERSRSRAQADEADVIVEHIMLEWQARKDAHFRHARSDVAAVSRAEFADDAALDLAQHDAADPHASVSAFYCLRDRAVRVVARARQLAQAATDRIGELEGARRDTRTSW